MQKKRVAGVAVSELTFGTLYAIFLTRTRLGRYLADEVTWFSVVVGVVGTCVLAVPLVGWRVLAYLALVFSSSGVPIITRSLLLEMRSRELWTEIGHLLGGKVSGRT